METNLSRAYTPQRELFRAHSVGWRPFLQADPDLENYVPSPPRGMETTHFAKLGTSQDTCSKPTVWDGDTGFMCEVCGVFSTFQAHCVGW